MRDRPCQCGVERGWTTRGGRRFAECSKPLGTLEKRNREWEAGVVGVPEVEPAGAPRGGGSAHEGGAEDALAVIIFL